MQQINARESTSKLDLTVLLRFTIRIDLRYGAQDRHRPVCTPKSLRRLRVRISPNFVSYSSRPTPVVLRVYSPQALPLTIHDARLRFKIYGSVRVKRTELPRYTTLESRPRNGTSNVQRKTILHEARFDET